MNKYVLKINTSGKVVGYIIGTNELSCNKPEKVVEQSKMLDIYSHKEKWGYYEGFGHSKGDILIIRAHIGDLSLHSRTYNWDHKGGLQRC